mmetsp:Transcript_10535/g.38767  ORF Transcript_10535/g.38767 Transcript_10535/m.38767 type:complete len:253 (+) Transcript_10535:354-1112(+)
MYQVASLHCLQSPRLHPNEGSSRPHPGAVSTCPHPPKLRVCIRWSPSSAGGSPSKCDPHLSVPPSGFLPVPSTAPKDPFQRPAPGSIGLQLGLGWKEQRAKGALLHPRRRNLCRRTGRSPARAGVGAGLAPRTPRPKRRLCRVLTVQTVSGDHGRELPLCLSEGRALGTGTDCRFGRTTPPLRTPCCAVHTVHMSGPTVAPAPRTRLALPLAPPRGSPSVCTVEPEDTWLPPSHTPVVPPGPASQTCAQFPS